MKTLENTTIYWIYDLTRSKGDNDLFDKISIAMTVFVLGSILLNIIRPIPYGKLAVVSKRPGKSIWTYELSSKFVWRYGFIATIIVPLAMVYLTPCKQIWNFCNATALAMHCVHYFNRTIIYPTKISPNATPQTLGFFLLMVLITTLHGFIQSHHLLNVHSTNVSYVTYFGIPFYIVGASINSHHDDLLVNLRKSASTTTEHSSDYKIPSGSLFEYVSCANYFGELMEWWGYFMVTRGYPQFLFATFATDFLVSRARFAHKFYKDKFGGAYPDSRKMIIPFIY